MSFLTLFTEEELKEIQNHDCGLKNNDVLPGFPYAGAIGGRITYMFTPTSIGTIYKAKCACGWEKDCTDYENW